MSPAKSPSHDRPEPRALARAEQRNMGLGMGPQDASELTRELQTINRELASLLGGEPVELFLGAHAALADELAICGILGGKDVGKSTLINSLARGMVSWDPVLVGMGRAARIVYVQVAWREAAVDRLRAVNRHVPLEVTVHQADAIRNVVLVDLPDFDSEFADHLHAVQSVAPLLDRVLWVQTPRKIGDRAWVEMFHRVIKDPRNVYCVLNKVDELLADGEPFEATGGDRDEGDDGPARLFWRHQGEWLAGSIEAAGCPQPDDHRFLVSAAFPEPDQFVAHVGERWGDPGWSKYSGDRPAVLEIAQLVRQEVERLRNCVLGPISPEESRALKAANQKREREVSAARIREHYQLDRMMERLAQACDPDYGQRALNEALGAEYCAAVASTLRTRLRPDTELADELLGRRVEGWPLLRLVHWPFGWLARAVGASGMFGPGRGAARARGRGSWDDVEDAFCVDGRSLDDRVELLRSRVLADHAVVVDQLRMESEIPSATVLVERALAAARRLPPRLEARVLEEIRGGDRKPSLFGKAALWLILLWFPFVQPVIEGGLETYAATGAWNFAHGLYRIVSAFSAIHLLAGFAVVGVIYVAVLAGMYARGLRAIRRRHDEQTHSALFDDAVDEILVFEVAVPVVKPFRDRLQRLADLLTRLDRPA